MSPRKRLKSAPRGARALGGAFLGSLAKELEQFERADPVVRAAAKRLDTVCDEILARPVRPHSS